mmetsp:Transcript_25386/g.63681  ORF Transcript_25386/g.63681 Transcript_25386/m.63681 type:complete len:276 (-) Transcript_25386:37-864(-)
MAGLWDVFHTTTHQTQPFKIPHLLSVDNALLFSAATAAWTLLYVVCAPLAARLLAPHTKKLSPQDVVNLHSKLVAFLHALIVCPGSSYILLADRELWDDRIFGYSSACRLLCGVSAGYFIWDSVFSVIHVKDSGAAFVFHGVACMIVYIFTLTPFMQFYAVVCLQYEWSTIFLNIGWLLQKLTPPAALGGLKMVNGLCLLAMFAIFRVALNSVVMVVVFYDFFHRFTDLGGWPFVPMFLYVLSAGVLLYLLNLYWFTRLLALLRRTMAAKKASTD